MTRTYTPTTDTSTVSSASVAGYAVRTRGNPKVYEALKLIESEAPTLLFSPTTYGSMPDLGATVTWNGKTYTVRDVLPVAPDGTGIIAKVVVA